MLDPSRSPIGRGSRDVVRVGPRSPRGDVGYILGTAGRSSSADVPHGRSRGKIIGIAADAERDRSGGGSRQK